MYNNLHRWPIIVVLTVFGFTALVSFLLSFSPDLVRCWLSWLSISFRVFCESDFIYKCHDSLTYLVAAVRDTEADDPAGEVYRHPADRLRFGNVPPRTSQFRRVDASLPRAWSHPRYGTTSFHFTGWSKKADIRHTRRMSAFLDHPVLLSVLQFAFCQIITTAARYRRHVHSSV